MKLTDYPVKAAPASDDLVLLVDVHDASQSPQGSVKVAAASSLSIAEGAIVPPAGDIGGTASAPTVVATHVPALAPVGLAGATAASRYVGATASGPPASGTFLLGDFSVDQTGKIWICTTAGSPGTWTPAGPVYPLTIAQGGTGSTARNFAGLLTPTPVKTSGYTAAAGDFVPCDTTSGSFTVTLPNAPADLTVVGVKQVTQGGVNTVTIACAGSDVFNKTGGATTAVLSLLAQGLLLQYKASAAIWYVLADDLALPQLDARYAGGVFNVKSYGATGNGVTDDTAACNAALLACHNAGSGTVVMPAGGTYLISAPLVIYSNTRLVARGATISLAANSNCNLIANFATTPNRSVTDAAITTGTNVLTSATAAFTGADVGATVAVTGGNQAGQVLTANIVSVTNGTTVVLDTNAQNTVTAAACSIYYRDSNIEIAGGTWNRNNNGYTTTGTAGQNSTQLRFIDGLYCHDMTFISGTAKGYQLSLAAVTNFTVKNITATAPGTLGNTDAVSVVGPAYRGVIDTVYGGVGDDFIALHTNANQGTVSAQVVGNIADILVTNIFPNGTGVAAVKINSSSGMTANAITVRTVHGTYNAAISFAFQQPNITDILVQDVDIVSPAASFVNLIFINCPNSPLGTLTFRDIALRSYASANAINMFQVQAGSILGTLVLENLTWEAGTAGNNSNVFQLLGTNGVTTTINNIIINKVTGQNSANIWTNLVQTQQFTAVGTVTLRDVTAFFTQAGNFPLVNIGGVAQTVILDGIYLNGGGELLETTGSASALQIIASNIVSYAAHRLFKFSNAAQVDLILTALNVNTLNQAGLINLGATTPVVTVWGSGLLNPTNVAAFNGSTPATPARVVHRDMRVDVATIAANLGDMAWNTNAASGPLGPVVYDGTKWDASYLNLDVTAADITPDGQQAAGAVGKAADSGHVHPATQGYTLADQGLLAQTFDPAFIGNGGATLISGTVYLARLRLATPQTITNILVPVAASAAAGITTALFGLYNSAGTLVASTANRSADTWTATSLNTEPLSSTFAAPAGLYWVAMLFVWGTTSPVIGRIGINGVWANAGLAAAATRFAVYATGGQAALPTPITPGTQLNQDSHAFWFGLS